MTSEGLLALVNRLLSDEINRAENPPALLVDTPSALYVFQKGGDHLALVVRPAKVDQ